MQSKPIVKKPDVAVGMSYGCIFCCTGKEVLVAQRIEQQHPLVQAHAVLKTKYRSAGKRKRLVDEVLIGGYVLFRAEGEPDMAGLQGVDDVISVLTYSDKTWQMYGADLRYAKWIFSMNGVIGLSKAYEMGNRIYIAQGPLKDLEASIIRIDRRNRSGQVSFTLGGNQIKTWLNFELMKNEALE